MRYFLTILAIIVILVFTAALAVPYLINWNDQRDIIAGRLSHFLGVPVKITGPIDLKLLPTPYLMLGQIEIADPNGKSTAAVDELRLEMALAPMLRGDVDFVEARILHPQIRVVIEDGTVRLPQFGKMSGDIRFDQIAIENGEITIEDRAAGRTYVAAGLELAASAPSLDGPFKGEGHVGRGADVSDFRFSTGSVEDNHLRFKFILDETKAHPRTELDGALAFAANGADLPTLDARMTLSGHGEGEMEFPWRLGGMLHAGLRKATLGELDLRLGDEDHSVNFAGAADFDLGAQPNAHFAITGKQINLDRLFADKTAPQRVDNLLRAAMARPTETPIPVTLDWSIESLLLGNETFEDISGSLGARDAKGVAFTFRGEGPGQSRLMLDGKLDTGSAPAFDGRIEAHADDLARLREWIAANLPNLKEAQNILPFRRFDIAGKINLSPVGFFGSDLRLRLDRSSLAGSVAYTRAVGADAPRFYADVTAETLDLDHLPDLHAAFDGVSATDVSLRVDSHAIKVADVGQGPIDAGRIVLKLTKAGPRVTLEKFDVAGLGGMNASAAGSFDGKTGHIDAKLDAAELNDAANLVRRLFPGPAAELFAGRAGALAPAHVELAADVQKTAPDRFALTGLSLKGVAAQTHIAAKLTPDAGAPSHVTFTGHVNAPETAALFRQIGLSTLPLPGLGGGQIDLSAEGELAKPLTAQVAATLAGTKIDFRGTLEPDLATPRAKGTLKLASSDLAGLLETTAIAFPDLTGRLPADLSGELDWQGTSVGVHKLAGTIANTPVAADLTYTAAPKRRVTGSLELGTASLAQFIELALGPMQQSAKAGQLWSEAAFSTGLIDPPTMQLAIKAKNFALWPGFVGQDAKLALEIASDQAGPKLDLRLIYARLSSGGAEADLALRRDGTNASLQGHVTIEDYHVALPSVEAVLSTDLDFASTGANLAALVTGLAGGGTVTFSDLALPHSDPRALGRVMTAAEHDQITIDEPTINRALTREFDKQPLVLRGGEFEAGFAGGLLRITPKPDTATESPAPEQKITASLKASADLRTMTLEQRTLLSIGALPKDWQGPPPQASLIWSGPIVHPERRLETANFTNVLAARAIARESARIEQQEFDQHERLFFYQRLKSERRREEERLKAEEDARRAAEEARRAAELAAGTTPQPSEERKVVPSPTPRAPAPLDLHRISPLPPTRPPSLREPW